MPWWIWLILALAMLAVLIAGIIYVIIHGLHALQSVQRTGEAVSERIALMSDTEGTRHPRSVPSSPSHSRWPPIDTRRPIRRWTNASGHVVNAMHESGAGGPHSTTDVDGENGRTKQKEQAFRVNRRA